MSPAPPAAAEGQGLDARRELSPRLLEALDTSGLVRLRLPRRLNGAELDPVSGLRACEWRCSGWWGRPAWARTR